MLNSLNVPENIFKIIKNLGTEIIKGANNCTFLLLSEKIY